MKESEEIGGNLESVNTVEGCEGFSNNLIQEMDSILRTDGLFFNALKGRLSKAKTDEILGYLSQQVAGRDQETVDKLSYYLQMFLAIPVVQELIDHKDFPDAILESLFFESYLICFYRKNQELDRFVADWKFLSQEKLLHLLLDTGHISDDLGVSLSLLVMLDNKGLDEFLKRRNQSEEFLLNIVRNIPVHKIERILAGFPLFSGYIYLILKTYDKKKASAILRMYRSHLRDLAAMDKIMKIVEKIPRNKVIQRFSEERILVIRELLQETSRPETIMNLLEARNVFESKLEIQIVKSYMKGDLVSAVG